MGQLTLAAAGSVILACPAVQARAQEETQERPQDAAADTPSTEAAPAPLQYEVKVNAPGDLDELLEKNLDLERFRGNPRMDREQLQRLVRDTPEQAKNLVATAGYYTPVVTVRVDTTGAKPVVIVDLDPGQPVTIDKVELELRGFDPTPPLAASEPYDTEALKRSWSLKTGSVFRQADWESAKRALLREVVQTRYPRAQLVDTQAVVDPETHKVSLLVVLDSGPELRFGELRIEGLKRYDASIIRNLDKIRPGEYYSESALQSFQARLQDTGYFASVEVSADMSSILNEQIEAGQESQQAEVEGASAAAEAKPVNRGPAPLLPLVVRVTENKQQNVSAGLGFSTNTGNRAQLNYDNLNVWGTRFKSAITMETKKQAAHANFYFPTTERGYNDSAGASFERSDISNEITAVTTISAKRNWGGTNLERSLTFEFLSEDKTVVGLEQTRSKSLPLTYAITKRSLDSLLFPTKGYVINAQVGGALLPVLTDERFVRVAGKAVYYRPLGEKGELIVRGEMGALGSKEKRGVPAVYLFRAGGDQSVRGYAYQELGVKEGDATIGGRYMLTGSAEYQYWFKPKWAIAAFYDAGNAADTVKAAMTPKSGYGLGGRYKSPVGPINVDVAYGHAVHAYRLHFSLGFTF
ncbi:autotransporter assembly complex protein TamA [Janthinobacterium lividum]|uniref:autotransporter assembly complex protein TamA n=1 Tax=Janthinobacterium lividum TaxID=29581 RepID=UPI00087591CD|nr:autotransporter assembly complex family protein [Janthinobacterium lividum]MCC7715691.1 outer membrane protein assembly factor [Janthinobacterium lividum]OEZ54836.1 translocation and assembly module TamA precursor [Janthinobacterium lividum]WQE29604.1 autotransporter assembly complex family protein [Janthinobacterium lividum]STQ95087.1 outer membrane protein assembly factor YaeT [Janthinobacterium lividum]